MRSDTTVFPFRTATIISLFGMGAVVAIFYIVFQARFLITGPQIVFTNELETVHNDRVVYLEGTAFNISRLWLNDRQIFTDASGHFNEALVLENGYTNSTLRAEDRYGRITTLERSFVYVPASFIQ